MKKGFALIACIACTLSSANGFARDGTTSPSTIAALQERLDRLASKYDEKCKFDDELTEKNLLLIERGAGLEEGVAFPVTMQILSVLRSLRKDVKDELCNRADEYRDLAKVAGRMVEEQRSTGP
jgi:hypothetical protein